MKIDLSLPQASAKICYLDANVRWGFRHIKIIACPKEFMGLIERIGHLVLGLMMMIPLLGHGLATLEKFVRGGISVTYLQETDPYKRGWEFGNQFKSETQFLYKIICKQIADLNSGNNDNKVGEILTKAGANELLSMMKGTKRNFAEERELLIKNVPAHIHQEMKGLSGGAGIPLEDVYSVHAFLDIYAGVYGCSALSSVVENGKVERVAKTNDFEAQNFPCPRLKALKTAPLHQNITDHRKALALATQLDTIQSVVFDINRKEVHLATAWEEAPKKIFSTFPVFENQAKTKSAKQVIAAFNLDWPWFMLAPYIKPVVFTSSNKKQFLNLTFPGYLGVLRGMNRDGVVVGCCQSGSSRQKGIPLTLLFRELLEECATAQEAERHLEARKPASSMNLLVAGQDGAFVAEIDPSRKQQGSALTKRCGFSHTEWNGQQFPLEKFRIDR